MRLQAVCPQRPWGQWKEDKVLYLAHRNQASTQAQRTLKAWVFYHPTIIPEPFWCPVVSEALGIDTGISRVFPELLSQQSKADKSCGVGGLLSPVGTALGMKRRERDFVPAWPLARILRLAE